jgi:hypothetical protein
VPKRQNPKKTIYSLIANRWKNKWKKMVFGLDEKQRSILAYLYSLKDTPESPPDQRLSVGSIAKSLNMTQQEVKNKTKNWSSGAMWGFSFLKVVDTIKFCHVEFWKWKKGLLKKLRWKLARKK